MRQIHLMKRYDIFIKKVKQHIIIDPLDRIHQGFKTTTYRLHPLKCANYEILQGSRYHPESIKDIYLNIFLVKKIPCCDLTVPEIQIDLGMTNEELNIFLKSEYSPQIQFFRGVQKINGISYKRIQIENFELPGYLCYFEMKNIAKLELGDIKRDE